MRDPSRQENGFTLVEVLIAMTILAIGLLAISQMQITSLQSNSSANRMAILNQLGSAAVDEILSWQADDPRLRTAVGNPHAYDFNPDPGVAETTVTLEGGGSFTATYSVQPGMPVSNVSTVTVIVSSGSVAKYFGLQRTFVALKRTQ
jgi:type IV pilus assembly protein PilV